MTDPRWEEVFAEVVRVSRDAQGFVDRFCSFMTLIEAIAADGVSAKDREAAQGILDDVAIRCRAPLPAIIHVLARLGKGAEEADIRADARRFLRDVTEGLPAVSDTLQ